MSEELFDVVFFGILQTGKDKDTAMQNMAKIFKTDPAKLAPYFSGGRKVIKRKVNAEMAGKYLAALENAAIDFQDRTCDITRLWTSEKNDSSRDFLRFSEAPHRDAPCGRFALIRIHA